jgi:hypothetical protein
LTRHTKKAALTRSLLPARFRQLTAFLDVALGDGSSGGYTYDSSMDRRERRQCVSNGAPTSFAQQHIFNGACPATSRWSDGNMLSWGQVDK